MKNLVALVSGVIFGLGLCVSQMVNPFKIIGFLDVAGNWDPTLLAVMAGALIVVSIGYRLILKRKQPLLDKQFYLPTNRHIDWKLICGATLFGIGWGLIGYCPGAIVTSLGFLSMDVLIVFFSLLAGMLVWNIVAENET